MPNGPTKPEPESFGEIVERFPPIRAPRPSSFLELSGTRQMNVLLAFICICAVAFLILWGMTRPNIEDVQTIAKAAGAAEGADAMKPADAATMLSELRREHFEQFREVFQIVVLSVLVPLFTLMAGYVFGKGKAAAADKNQ